MRRAKSRGSVRERWPLFERPEELDPNAVYRDDPGDKPDRRTGEEKRKAAEAVYAALLKLAEQRADEQIDVALLPMEELAGHRWAIGKHWRVPEEERDLAWMTRWREIQRELVSATVRAVYGIEVDGEEIGERPPEEILRRLEAAEALADVTWAALRAQSLTREEAGFFVPSEPIEAARS